jgi:uncharacterized protein DUF5946
MDAFYGPDHPYIGASPGCWQIYNEVTAKELTNPAYASLRGLRVDTYMVQHPGAPSPQSIQSVAAHLIGLYLALEKGFPPDKAIRFQNRLRKDHLVWLEPPPSLGVLTIVDIAQAADARAYLELVKQWAVATWQAWNAHHATIRQWAKQ